MAQEVTVTMRHAVFDTFNFQCGKPPAVDTNDDQLTALLVAGDSVLDRSEGFFFETVDGDFVFAFEQPREDDHARHRSMAYFDVFSAPVEHVEGVRLTGLRDRLRDERAQSYAAAVEGRAQIRPVEVQVPKLTGGAGAVPDRSGSDESTAVDDDGFLDVEDLHSDGPSDHSDEEGADQGGSGDVDRESFDPEFVADLWEQYRRDDLQLRTSLRAVDRFCYFVDGALPELCFVSRERKRGEYFDIVAGTDDENYSTNRLASLVEGLHSTGQLALEELPMYEDQARALKDEKVADLRSVETVMDDVDRMLDAVRDEIEAAVEETMAERTETLDATYEGKLPPEEEADEGRISSRITDGMRGVVVGGDDPHPLAAELDLDRVHDETVDYLVQRLVEEPVEGGLCDRREDIVDEFDRTLSDYEEELRETMTRHLVQTLDAVRGTTAYQRAYPQERWEEE